MRATARHEGFEAIRLDTFVDGAFAFTLTLLVTGGEEADSEGLWLSLLLVFFALIFLYPLHISSTRCT
jgi:hypothetical protein